MPRNAIGSGTSAVSGCQKPSPRRITSASPTRNLRMKKLAIGCLVVVVVVGAAVVGIGY